MRRHAINSKLRPIAQLAFGLVVASLSPTFAQENSGVQISFSDTNNDPAQTHGPNRASQVSFQESDFAPNPSHNQTGRPEKGSTRRNGVRLGAPNSRQTQGRIQLKEQMQESDKPVRPPTFNLTDRDSGNQKNVPPNSANQSAASRRNDSYRLPRLGDVRSPIPAVPLMGMIQADPSGLLAADQFQNNSNGVVDRYSSYSSLKSAISLPKFKTWKAHNFYHRPTYFEDNNLERNGNERPYQNMASGLRFFLAIPAIPYRVGEQNPKSRIYTHGNSRPGDCTPFQIEGRVPSRRGAVLQTISSSGILPP